MTNVLNAFPIEAAPRLGAGFVAIHPLYAASSDAEIAREFNWILMVG